MIWGSLAAARQGGEMDRLARESVAGVPAPATIAFLGSPDDLFKPLGWTAPRHKCQNWSCEQPRPKPTMTQYIA